MSVRISDTRHPVREIAVRPDARRRTGHRQEARDPDDPRSARARKEAALVDVSVHRTVAYRDMVNAHFDGHPYAARRAIDRLIAQGLLRERIATAPGGGSFRTLAATRKGAQYARKAAERHGFDASQRFRAGWGRPRDAAHDVAIYRAVRAAREELAALGATARRIRLDGELRGIVARRSETARARAGRAAADAERPALQRRQDRREGRGRLRPLRLQRQGRPEHPQPRRPRGQGRHGSGHERPRRLEPSAIRPLRNLTMLDFVSPPALLWLCGCGAVFCCLAVLRHRLNRDAGRRKPPRDPNSFGTVRLVLGIALSSLRLAFLRLRIALLRAAMCVMRRIRRRNTSPRPTNTRCTPGK